MGYPGWHIECSCISKKHLGEYCDIHCGGVDNMFPHHTNEIAQSEAYLGHSWCTQWLHVAHLNDETGKMSKSKGEFLTVSLLESKGYNPLAYRLFCLQSHYRKNLVFSYDALDNATQQYEKLVQKIAQLDFEDKSELDQAAIDKLQDKFTKNLALDLNTANAISVLYDVLKADTNDRTKLYLIEDFDYVLSLDLRKAAEKLKAEQAEREANRYAGIPEEIVQMVEERAAAKKAKDFAKADELRDKVKALGYTIKDTPQGAEIVKD